MLRNCRAQAVLELAILGSLVIMAFSIAIEYSEQANHDQAVMHRTFRATLKKAKALNSSATWSSMEYSRLPNITNPMELGAIQQSGSTNNVLWADGKEAAAGKKAAESESWSQVNQEEPTLVPQTPAPLPGTVKTTSSGYSTTATAVTTFTKKEGNGNISTYKSLRVTGDIAGPIDRERTMQ